MDRQTKNSTMMIDAHLNAFEKSDVFTPEEIADEPEACAQLVPEWYKLGHK